jgi:hypothetical protein
MFFFREVHQYVKTPNNSHRAVGGAHGMREDQEDGREEGRECEREEERKTIWNCQTRTLHPTLPIAMKFEKTPDDCKHLILAK